MAYADADDVAARLGRELDDTEAQIVNIRLSDAELILRSRIRDLDEKVAADSVFADAVKMIEAEMVLRLIRNPEGFLQESDGNYSYMVNAAVANGRLNVLDEEWRLLGVRKTISTARTKVTKTSLSCCSWGPHIDQWWFPCEDEESS